MDRRSKPGICLARDAAFPGGSPIARSGRRGYPRSTLSCREVNRHRQRRPAPLAEVAAVRRLVFLEEQPPREVVFLTAFDNPPNAGELAVADANGNLGRLREIAHPVRALPRTVAREYVKRSSVECEPDLDCMWPSSNAASGREIAERLAS